MINRIIITVCIKIGNKNTLINIPNKVPVRINKPPNCWIIISGLEVVHADFGIVVIAAVAEGVDIGDVAGGAVLGDGALAPGVVAIAGHLGAVLVSHGDDIALEILPEEVGHVVILDAADGFLVVVERDQRIAAPGFLMPVCIFSIGHFSPAVNRQKTAAPRKVRLMLQ